MDVEELGPVERKLRIEIPTAEVDAAFEAVYRDYRKSARLKGFRKGRAPRSVLERYFGDQARGDALERLVRDSYPRAVEEHELAVVADPRIQPEGEVREGSPLVYEATVEIRPQIELAKVKGLEVEAPVLPVPDEDPVQKYLEDLRAAHAQLVAVEGDARAARGHVAVIELSGSIDGEAVQGDGEERHIELGAGSTPDGFDDELLGMEPGDEREFELEMPGPPSASEVSDEDASRDAAPATRRGQFRVKLVELKRKELPELDDEFAKDVSESETLEELRTQVRERVDEGREQEKQRLVRERVIEALVEANPFPVPPSLVERQLHNRIARAAGSFGGQLPEEQLRPLVERWREEWRPMAEKEVRLALLVPEIASAEEIAVADEEVDAELAEIAKREQQPLTKVRQVYRERGMLDSVRAALLEERVVEFAVSQATLQGS